MRNNYLLYIISKIIHKSQIPSIKDSIIDINSRICSKSNILNSTIERYSYVGNNCSIIHANIGMFCSIADNAYIGGASHPINWFSTSPVFHTHNNLLKESFTSNYFDCYSKTTIGHDVWIGANCNIKGGVRIGTGSIIGMGSVVTKDVGDYELWGGNPARCIKKRFSDDISLRLINSKWWEMDVNLIRNFSDQFNDPESFLAVIEKIK